MAPVDAVWQEMRVRRRKGSVSEWEGRAVDCEDSVKDEIGLSMDDEQYKEDGSARSEEAKEVQGEASRSYHESRVQDDDAIDYIRGPRYWAIVFVIAIMFFLTTIDTTIAATSLVAITDDLGGFEMASWILTSYLLGYVAVIVILAKLSDIFGRKTVTIGCIIVFTLFSAGCAAAQTLTQLIILRAFQGVGGGGSFALSSILLIESVPPEKYADAVTKNGVAIILALVLGPMLGGAISEHTTWRWIFLINIPIGAFVTVLALVGIPNGFPYQGRPEPRHQPGTGGIVWGKIDLPGTALILLATLSFTACFQEAESRFSWDSAYVITLLVASAVLWGALMVWERYVTLAMGAPVAVTNFQLPQRFELINGLSNFNAGVRIIPFGVAFAFGTMLSGKLASKLRVPGIYLILLGALLQVAGYALLGTLSPSKAIQPGIYGYQVMAGIGCSFSYSNLIMLVAFTAEKRDGDEAVALGAANQFRAMGAAIGLAIVTSVFNGYVGSRFSQLGITVPVTTLATRHRSFLPPSLEGDIRNILSEGYNLQMLTLCAFGAAQVPAALLMWRRKQVVVA
ncbi:major facilitator superfamily domain-containing protein [Massariosphaeria phaeospora]|uniref:Major facilitator superfamily domain-containing protein n=1 Tax=Massariosphaeria phaeospora TaxID=100035 RepID=A0A7C8I1J1_9PLEO|nr:major facilitator superfamily domain-containing protein [Massariosphaeria phaeospora]